MSPYPTPQHSPIGPKGPDGEAASALPPQVVNILVALINRQVLRILAILEAMFEAWRAGHLPAPIESPSRRRATPAGPRPAPPRRWSLFGHWVTPAPEWRLPAPAPYPAAQPPHGSTPKLAPARAPRPRSPRPHAKARVAAQPDPVLRRPALTAPRGPAPSCFARQHASARPHVLHHARAGPRPAPKTLGPPTPMLAPFVPIS